MALALFGISAYAIPNYNTVCVSRCGPRLSLNSMSSSRLGIIFSLNLTLCFFLLLG